MPLTTRKLPVMPSGRGNDFDRSEDKDLKIAGQTPVEIFSLVVAGGALGSTTQEVQTGMNFVQGGYLYSISDDAVIAASDVTPKSTDPTIATFSNVPVTDAKQYIAVVFGEKNPAALI